MAQTYTLQFIHRLNDDGTIDSICRDCFVTVATSLSGAQLEREEQEHTCDPLLIDAIKRSRHIEKISLCRDLLTDKA